MIDFGAFILDCQNHLTLTNAAAQIAVRQRSTQVCLSGGQMRWRFLPEIKAVSSWFLHKRYGKSEEKATGRRTRLNAFKTLGADDLTVAQRRPSRMASTSPPNGVPTEIGIVFCPIFLNLTNFTPIRMSAAAIYHMWRMIGASCAPRGGDRPYATNFCASLRRCVNYDVISARILLPLGIRQLPGTEKRHSSFPMGVLLSPFTAGASMAVGRSLVNEGELVLKRWFISGDERGAVPGDRCAGNAVMSVSSFSALALKRLKGVVCGDIRIADVEKSYHLKSSRATNGWLPDRWPDSSTHMIG